MTETCVLTLFLPVSIFHHHPVLVSVGMFSSLSPCHFLLFVCDFIIFFLPPSHILMASVNLLPVSDHYEEPSLASCEKFTCCVTYSTNTMTV